MGNVQNEVLTEQHLAVFGAILQCFARYELTLERAIAGLLQTEASSIATLMRQLDFTAKRLALLDLLRERSIPGDRWERIYAHLAVPASQVGLRNQIAHSTWRASPQPKSIQPDWILRWAPSIESSQPGSRPEDGGYTFEMLSEVAANLAMNHERFLAYLTEAGFISVAA